MADRRGGHFDAAADPARWFDEQSVAEHLIATAPVAEVVAVLDGIEALGLQVHVYLDASVLTSWTLVDTPPDDEQFEPILGYRFIRPGSEDRLLHLAPAASHASQSGAARLRSALLDLLTVAHLVPFDLHIDFLISHSDDVDKDSLTQVERSALGQWRRELADPAFEVVLDRLEVVLLDQNYRDRLAGEFTSTNPQPRSRPLERLLAGRIAASHAPTAFVSRLAAFDAETTSLARRHAAESLRPSLTRRLHKKTAAPKGYLKALDRDPNQIEWARSRSAQWVFEHLLKAAGHTASRDLAKFLESRRIDLAVALAEVVEPTEADELAATLATVLSAREFKISHKRLTDEVSRSRTLVKGHKVKIAQHPGPWANLLFGNENWRKSTYAAALAALSPSAINDIVNGACEGFIKIAIEWAEEHRDMAGVATSHLLGDTSPEEIQGLLVPLLEQLVEQA